MSEGTRGAAPAGSAQSGRVEDPGADYVRFWPAGDRAKGEFHCSDCGYGVTVYTTLPRCPMCGGEAWEQSSWSPFSRAAEPGAR